VQAAGGLAFFEFLGPPASCRPFFELKTKVPAGSRRSQEVCFSFREHATLITAHWRSRGYLPHWEAGEVSQSLTFRLGDSLPTAVLEQWRAELARLPEGAATLERRIRIEHALDRGHGEAWLADARIKRNESCWER